MSRSRNFLITDSRRLRNNKPIYQASDSEIQADLKKMKYTVKAEPVPLVEAPIKVQLPKKRKPPVEDDKFVIDGLLKLMSFKPQEPIKKQPEIVKKQPEVVEKKVDTPQKGLIPRDVAYASMLAFQNHIMRNTMIMSQFNNLLNYQQPILFTSSADRHLKAARFIQSHKVNSKNPLHK